MKNSRTSILYFFPLFISINLFAQDFDSYLSNEGKGLYFTNILPKKSTPLLISKTELSADYQYANLYEDQYSKRIYLHSSSKIKEINEVIKKSSSKSTSQNENSMDRLAGVQDSYGFIKRNSSLPGIALEMPQHHLFANRLQNINPNRPNLKLDVILEKLNSLGLNRSQYVTTKGGGFNIHYDRLFINDDDINKLLIIWLNEDQVFANFISNSGKWEFESPKIIHRDIICNGKSGNIYQRDILGSSDKSTLITELNCIKSGDKFYVGYSITTWEASPCFNSNLASCHLSILNSSLNVERTIQLPSYVQVDEPNLFASDFQLKLYINNDTLSAVIQSPNVGEDKLFVQCFDNKLNPIGNMMYLSCHSKTYADLIPVVLSPGGFLITYKEVKSTGIDLYTQFVASKGTASIPVCVYSFEGYMSTYLVQKDPQNNLNYYFILHDDSTEKDYLYHYQLPLKKYWEDLSYEITKDNWKQDSRIKEIDILKNKIDELELKKSLTEFNTEPQTGKPTKKAYVDRNFRIIKYTYEYKESSSRGNSSIIIKLYYDKNNKVRFADLYIEKPSKDIANSIDQDTIRVYYNPDGIKIWEIKVTKEGKEYVRPNEVRSERYLNRLQIEKPFDDFHSN